MKIIEQWGVSAQPIRYTCSNKRIPDSQFPTALLALESFFGLLLGSCASAAWTLHRAHLCQRAFRSSCEDIEFGLHRSLLQSLLIGIRRDAVQFVGISGSTTPMSKSALQNQSVEAPRGVDSNSERTSRYQVIFPATLPICRTRTKEAQKTCSTHSLLLPRYSPGTSSCGTSCVRTSPSSASPASSTPFTTSASNAFLSSSNSSTLSESAPWTSDNPCKSPDCWPDRPPSPSGASATVSTLWPFSRSCFLGTPAVFPLGKHFFHFRSLRIDDVSYVSMPNHSTAFLASGRPIHLSAIKPPACSHARVPGPRQGVRLVYPCAKDAFKSEVRAYQERDGPTREKLNQRICKN